MDEAELRQLKARIDRLQTLYLVLFIGSLAALALQWVAHLGGGVRVAWFLLLGGAVVTRIYRTSLVNKYNARVTGTLQ